MRSIHAAVPRLGSACHSLQSVNGQVSRCVLPSSSYYIRCLNSPQYLTHKPANSTHSGITVKHVTQQCNLSVSCKVLRRLLRKPFSGSNQCKALLHTARSQALAQPTNMPQAGTDRQEYSSFQVCRTARSSPPINGGCTHQWRLMPRKLHFVFYTPGICNSYIQVQSLCTDQPTNTVQNTYTKHNVKPSHRFSMHNEAAAAPASTAQLSTAQPALSNFSHPKCK